MPFRSKSAASSSDNQLPSTVSGLLQGAHTLGAIASPNMVSTSTTSTGSKDELIRSDGGPVLVLAGEDAQRQGQQTRQTKQTTQKAEASPSRFLSPSPLGFTTVPLPAQPMSSSASSGGQASAPYGFETPKKSLSLSHGKAWGKDVPGEYRIPIKTRLLFASG